jgi:response regulator NasT
VLWPPAQLAGILRCNILGTASEAATSGASEALRILVIDENPERSELVRAGLTEAGYSIVASIRPDVDLRQRIAAVEPDLIIVDMDSPQRDFLEHLFQINRETPRPIAMFVAEGEPEVIAEAVEAGVSMYAVDGLSPKLARSVLQLAMAQFGRFRDLQAELEKSRTALADRRRIEKAKGVLMGLKGFNEDQAYKALRRMAMDRNMRLADVADTVIAMESLLKS